MTSSRDRASSRARCLRARRSRSTGRRSILDADVKVVSDTFNVGAEEDAIRERGRDAHQLDRSRRRRLDDGCPACLGRCATTLADVLEPAADVPAQFFVEGEELEKWQFLKGAKSLTRISRATGMEYTYDEGAIPFPDTDGPSRTILTGEGGATASRFKHIIRTDDGRYRRLTPRELERLNGFPGDWTAGMSDGKRAFMMGNALVVGVVERIADELDQGHRDASRPRRPRRRRARSVWPDSNSRTRRRAARRSATSCGPTVRETLARNGAYAKALREAGLGGYRLNWRKAPGRPDIAYPGRKLAIFVHGCYWHHCPRCYPNLPKSTLTSGLGNSS